MIDIDRSWGVVGTFVHGGTESEIGNGDWKTSRSARDRTNGTHYDTFSRGFSI